MIKSTGGLNLYTKNYLVPNSQANLLIVHGLGEYSDRYAHVAEACNAHNINVFTFDLRGHGRSEGVQAFIKSVDEYREDLEHVYQSIPKDLPFFVLGHSMGGLITLDFLMFRKRDNIKGVVFSGPAFEKGADITPITVKVVQLLSFIAPKLKTIKLDINSISRDPKEVEKYGTDPLIYREGTKAGLAAALLKKIQELKLKFASFDYPVLMMHGSADKITNPAGTKELFAKCISADKTIKIWDEAFHEIFNETNKTEVIKTTIDWVKNRI